MACLHYGGLRHRHEKPSRRRRRYDVGDVKEVQDVGDVKRQEVLERKNWGNHYIS